MMSTNPDQVSGRSAAMPLLKLKHGSELIVTCISTAPVYVGTHWFGKQFVCGGEDCAGCIHEQPRTRGYWAALVDVPHSAGTRRRMLIESSAAALVDLSSPRLFDELVGPWLFGERISVRRRPGKGGLEFGRLDERDPSTSSTPGVQRVRLASAVACLHGLPPMADGETDEAYSTRVHELAVGISKRIVAKASEKW